MTTLSFKVKHIKKILNTNFFPVGIKIIRDENQQWDASFQEVKEDTRFCYYVRLAAQGNSYIIKNDDKFECSTPYFCLGFKEPKYADFYPRITPAITKAVLVAPLDCLDLPIDSVIFIVNAKQAMLLIDGLRRIFKEKINVTLGASMSVCGEIVAHTIVKDAPNLSVLCGGARIFSGYKDDELVLGIPFHLFNPLYENLVKIEKLLTLEMKLKNNEVK